MQEQEEWRPPTIVSGSLASAVGVGILWVFPDTPEAAYVAVTAAAFVVDAVRIGMTASIVALRNHFAQKKLEKKRAELNSLIEKRKEAYMAEMNTLQDEEAQAIARQGYRSSSEAQDRLMTISLDEFVALSSSKRNPFDEIIDGVRGRLHARHGPGDDDGTSA